MTNKQLQYLDESSADLLSDLYGMLHTEEDKLLAILKDPKHLQLALDSQLYRANSLLARACSKERMRVIRFLVNKGDRSFGKNALTRAIGRGNTTLTELLLKQGEDPNADRYCVTAANCRGDGLSALKLLVTHGAKLNRVFAMFGDPNDTQTVLDFCPNDGEIRQFLLANGAKSAAKMLAENPNVEIEGVE